MPITTADAETQLMQGADLGEVFEVSREGKEALRSRALELFVARRYQDCVDVLSGLAALGDVHPTDAMLLSRCLTATNRPDDAFAAYDSATRLLEGMGLIIPEV